jgi:hypothetical protein
MIITNHHDRDCSESWNNDNQHDDSLESWFCPTISLETKEEWIGDCLSSPENINLWELRQLAISQGGLLSVKWRQRAWPKFVAAHESIWRAQKQQQQQQLDKSDNDNELYHPTLEDIKEIRRLVKQTVWSLRPNTNTSSSRSQKEPPSGSINQPSQEPQKDANDKDESNKENQSYESNNKNADNDNDNPSKSDGLLRRVSFQVPEDATTACTTTTSTNKEERQMLRKVLIHLKRTNPSYSQFPGIQNLIAVLFIVLQQSASTTSLVVQQLITHHWVPPKGDTPSSTDDFYMRVLQRCDPVLYQFWGSEYGVSSTPYPIRSSWIPCWFSQDIFQLNVLLRIWDVFLVSHPQLPMYVLYLTCTVYYLTFCYHVNE